MALIPCPGCTLPRTASDASAECPVCGYQSAPAAAPDDDDASALVLGPDIEPVSARARSGASAKIPKATIGGTKGPSHPVSAPIHLTPGPMSAMNKLPPAPVSAQVYMATAPVTAKIRRTSAPPPLDDLIALAVAAPPSAPHAPARKPDFPPAPVPAFGPYHQPMMVPVPARQPVVPWVLAGLGLGVALTAAVGWYLAISALPSPAASPDPTERVVIRDTKPPEPPADFDPNALEVAPLPRPAFPVGDVAGTRD